MRNEFALGQKSHGKPAAEIAGRAATGLLTVIPGREANPGISRFRVRCSRIAPECRRPLRLSGDAGDQEIQGRPCSPFDVGAIDAVSHPGRLRSASSAICVDSVPLFPAVTGDRGL
jgi:hypothetical protein